MRINWYKIARKPTFRELESYRQRAIAYAQNNADLIFGQITGLLHKAPKQVYLTGSVLQPKRFNERSDLDLWVVVDEVADPHELAGKIHADISVYDVFISTKKPLHPYLVLYDEEEIDYDETNLHIDPEEFVGIEREI